RPTPPPLAGSSGLLSSDLEQVGGGASPASDREGREGAERRQTDPGRAFPHQGIGAAIPREGMAVMAEAWFKRSVIYEVDVRTFFDSDGDGRGDLQGLTRKLDYIAGLGVSAIWLNPFFESPDRDGGYDISDYYTVDPALGSLGDFAVLLEEAKSLGLKVIIDLVVNHTSDQHPWFQEALTSRHAPRILDRIDRDD